MLLLSSGKSSILLACKNSSADFLACSKICISLVRSVKLSSGSPLCLTPKNAPGPLISRSFSAITKPSFVWVMICNLVIVSWLDEDEIKTQ